MTLFRVDDMTCGHCVKAITQAIRSVDERAQVGVDLAQHLVTVAATSASAQALQEAIAAAGYTPVPVSVAPAEARPSKSGSGCCCKA